MENMKIGVFDSGIGGLTVLEAIREVLPNEEYYYYADSLNNPYGDRSTIELYKITTEIVEHLIKHNCKIIVIACNTATTKCISYLREKYKDIIFIGTEPAIKVACDKNYKNILLLATPLTINSERTHVLIEKSKKEDENIYLSPSSGLAHAIETNNTLLEEEIIKSIYEEYKDKNIDAIILGCTHYPIISDLINKYFKDVVLLDGRSGVARIVYKKFTENNLRSTNKRGKVEVYNSLNKTTIVK